MPILMTAMAAGLALIPLAMGSGKSGNEIQTPMAIVILCGLITSTLLNMVACPHSIPSTPDRQNDGERSQPFRPGVAPTWPGVSTPQAHGRLRGCHSGTTPGCMTSKS